MTRIPWAVWRPGPPSKRGYGGVTSNSLDWKEGEVKHSAEGSLAAMFAVLDSDRQASWHFSLPKAGPVRVYQHYELEDICWHCGLPGDMRHDTSLIGNITLIGEEHEGRLSEPLTPWQLENTILLSRELRARCPAIGRRPPALRANLWEHNWLSSTACPSGRIPWASIIPALSIPPPPPKEDDMTPEEVRAIAETAARTLLSTTLHEAIAAGRALKPGSRFVAEGDDEQWLLVANAAGQRFRKHLTSQATIDGYGLNDRPLVTVPPLTLLFIPVEESLVQPGSFKS
jgi:N-acetylmuramoyl-L-alanine amidase